jgi:hypothetical protein
VAAGLGVPSLASAERSASRDADLPAPVVETRAMRAHEVVHVRWTPLDDAEELELLLSLDGGRTYPVRVSPELEGDETGYHWRVPGLSAPAARIRIRARIGGREVNGPPSDAFAIVSDPDEAPEWVFHESGWWGMVDPSRVAATMGRASPELRALRRSLPGEAPASFTLSPPPRQSSSRLPVVSLRTGSPMATLVSSRSLARRE